MRLSGSLAVFGLVSFFFMPSILAQNESLREPPSGWGGFKFMPCAFAEARPFAFKPPFGFLPSLRVHAGVLAIKYRCGYGCANPNKEPIGAKNAFAGNLDWQANRGKRVNLNDQVAVGIGRT